MIEITPAIMGPGIEEEYADALAAIADLRRAMGERPLTNSTPDGRVLLEVAWIEQETRRRRLPIPVDASYAGTIYYLIGSNELSGMAGAIDPAGIKDALGRLYRVLQGIGLIKPRHIPLLLAMIDDLDADARKVWEQLTPEERASMEDLRAESEIIRQGGWPAPRRPQDQFPIVDTPNLDQLLENFGNRSRDISSAIYEGWRPYRAKKPPLAAPVPGLPDRAPPLPDELEGRLP